MEASSPLFIGWMIFTAFVNVYSRLSMSCDEMEIKMKRSLRRFLIGAAVFPALILLGACGSGSGDGTVTPVPIDVGNGRFVVDSPAELISLLMTRFVSSSDYDIWDCKNSPERSAGTTYYQNNDYAFFSTTEGQRDTTAGGILDVENGIGESYEYTTEFSYEANSGDSVLLSYNNGDQEEITSITFLNDRRSWMGFSATGTELECQLNSRVSSG